MMACFFAFFRFGFKALLAAEAPRVRALLRNKALSAAAMNLFNTDCALSRLDAVPFPYIARQAARGCCYCDWMVFTKKSIRDIASVMETCHKSGFSESISCFSSCFMQLKNKHVPMDGCRSNTTLCTLLGHLIDGTQSGAASDYQQ